MDLKFQPNTIIIMECDCMSKDFSVKLLKDLINEGYSDDEIVKQFDVESENIKKAVANLLKEADAIAAGKKESLTIDDIFGSEV
jgi:hypothetical protein